MNNIDQQSYLNDDVPFLKELSKEMDKLFDLREKLGSPIPREPEPY